MVRILAICHTIIVDNKNGTLIYNASSPDELALTNAARHFGLKFMDRDEDGNMLIHNKFTNQVEKFELLNVIEFTSARKRMTVIVRGPDGKIIVMTKGADSIIIPRLSAGQEKLIDQTQEFLTGYANDGLRTLILAQKVVEEEEYAEWSKKYQKAICEVNDREKYINEAAELIENGLTLVGSTAIEDKLQDDVGEVISYIRSAKIKLWVLTGDKIETAINIGFSCKLLDDEMEIFIIDQESTKGIYHQI